MSCWILTNLRSGSGYLCYLLNKTSLFVPHFEEWFDNGQNINYIYGDNKANSNFNKHKDSLNYVKIHGLPKFLKIQRFRYDKIFNKNDKNIIKQILPDIKFIYLKRNDIFARAISLYFCSQTKTYHITKNDEDSKKWLSKSNVKDFKNWKNIHIPFIEKKVVSCYNKIIKDRSWDDFLTDENYLLLDYDELTTDPNKTLKEILKFLDIKSPKNIKNIINTCSLMKTNRSETDEYIKKLKRLIGGHVRSDK